MRSLFILLAMVFTLSVASAQIRWDQLEKVADTDAAAPELKKWQQRVEAEYRQGGMIIPRFSPPFELPFESLKILFPQHRFFAISWLETPAPGKEKDALGLSSPEITLVCDAAGKIVKEVNQTGNYEVLLDAELHVKTARLRADEIKKP